MEMKLLKKGFLPALAVLAITILSGCVAEVEVRRGRYYSDRVWHSDPYCRYNYGYGCGWSGRDYDRVRIIHGRRWNHGHFDSSNVSAAKATSWQSEFGLKSNQVSFIRQAFSSALEGKTAPLESIGFTRSDVRQVMKFQSPSPSGIDKAARALRVPRQDLSDFLELFTLRMKSAYAANEKFE